MSGNHFSNKEPDSAAPITAPKEETAPFLPGDQEAAVPVVVVQNKVPPRTVSPGCSLKNRRCCCCACSWLCISLTVVGILVLIGIILLAGYLHFRSKLTGTASSEDSHLWEAKLSGQDYQGEGSLINGTFELVSFNEDYKRYLEAMELPGLVVSMILSSSEVSSLIQPEHPDGNWTRIIKTDLNVRESVFQMNQTTSFSWGRNAGVMESFCYIAGSADNILVCDIKEPAKQWYIRTESIFSPQGCIEERHFITKQIRAKKYYKRISPFKSNQNLVDDTEQVSELEQQLRSASQSTKPPNPFGDDEDDAADLFRPSGGSKKKSGSNADSDFSVFDDDFFNND